MNRRSKRLTRKEERQTLQDEFVRMCKATREVFQQRGSTQTLAHMVCESRRLGRNAVKVKDTLLAAECFQLASVIALHFNDTARAIRCARQGLAIHDYPALRMHLKVCSKIHEHLRSQSKKSRGSRGGAA